MEITNFGHFTAVEREPLVFYVNEDGNDWYEMRRSLTEWEMVTGAYINAVYGAWATADADGVITNVERDPSRLIPDDRTVLGIDAKHTDIKPGMVYREGKLS